MRVALLGGGTIARLVMEHVSRGTFAGLELVALMGQAGGSARARELAARYGVAFVQERDALLQAQPQVVIEAASHAAVREHLVPLLRAGVGVAVLSAGALIDDALRLAAQGASRDTGATLYVPSGGIGGLDALKTACLAGVDEVSIQVAKPAPAWKGVPYVDRLGVDLEQLKCAVTLFEGSAREGVPHFPQNANVAAILSLAGIGADRTRLKIVADPTLTINTHTIRVRGNVGQFTLAFENLPAPDNPKTSYLACFSALAALQELSGTVRYGT
jgi:aspartate dehydrogenase